MSLESRGCGAAWNTQPGFQSCPDDFSEMIYCGALFCPGRPRFVLGAASLFCHGHQSPVTPPSLPHSEAQPGRGVGGGRAGAHLAWAPQAGGGGRGALGRSGPLAPAGSPASWKELFSHLRVWLSCSLEDPGLPACVACQ